jgi:hypothetical protein
MRKFLIVKPKPDDVKVNIAMIGSREFTNYDLFEKKVQQALQEWGLSNHNINRIVSGGARGADTLADQYARKYKIPLTTHIPDWKAFGKAAGVMRNTDIINDSDYIVAFPSRQGRGTQDSIRKARNSTPPKKLFVFYVD